MKQITHVLLLFVLHLSAQPKVSFIKGKIEASKPLSNIRLSNTEGLDVTIPVNKSQQFSYNCTTLKKGFYYLDEIGTVYLAPSYQLQIIPNKQGDYTFFGKGSRENNNYRKAKKRLSIFLPTKNTDNRCELGQDAYFLEVPVFKQKLDSFQQQGILLFNKSLDTFYRKYAKLDLSFYCRHLLGYYSLYYNVDFKLNRIISDSIDRLDQESTDFIAKMNSLKATTHKKNMNNN